MWDIKLCNGSINFKQYEPQSNEVLAQSEVLKALHEQENATAGVAGLPEYQEDRRSNFVTIFFLFAL